MVLDELPPEDFEGVEGLDEELRLTLLEAVAAEVLDGELEALSAAAASEEEPSAEEFVALPPQALSSSIPVREKVIHTEATL